jgi:hypothetical protein
LHDVFIPEDSRRRKHTTIGLKEPTEQADLTLETIRPTAEHPTQGRVKPFGHWQTPLTHRQSHGVPGRQHAERVADKGIRRETMRESFEQRCEHAHMLDDQPKIRRDLLLEANPS